MSILEAEEFARKYHEGQYRKYISGEPYIVHPERVAKRVTQYTTDKDVISAAWLHDVVEDCNVTLFDLALTFNLRVVGMVRDLTNPSKNFPQLLRSERKRMDRDHLANCNANVQLIKVIDRIDNLNDIHHADDSFRKLYKKESALLVNELKLAPQDLLDELIMLTEA